MVEECLAAGDPKIYNRAKYMVEEIARLQKGCEDLQQHDLVSFGKKMFDTHDGLSSLYEVSCKEADGLVNMVRNHPGVIGARMMGGGFGGCTINIVKKEAVDALVTEVAAAYATQFNRELKTYRVTIDNGTSIL